MQNHGYSNSTKKITSLYTSSIPLENRCHGESQWKSPPKHLRGVHTLLVRADSHRIKREYCSRTLQYFIFHIHTHAATLGNVGELGTSDEGLSTGHIIGISFGILGLLVTIIVVVSIALVKHYINKQRTEREPNSNGHVIPSKFIIVFSDIIS